MQLCMRKGFVTSEVLDSNSSQVWRAALCYTPDSMFLTYYSKVGKLWPTDPNLAQNVFINKVLLNYSNAIHLYIVCGHFALQWQS